MRENQNVVLIQFLNIHNFISLHHSNKEKKAVGESNLIEIKCTSKLQDLSLLSTLHSPLTLCATLDFVHDSASKQMMKGKHGEMVGKKR